MSNLVVDSKGKSVFFDHKVFAQLTAGHTQFGQLQFAGIVSRFASSFPLGKPGDDAAASGCTFPEGVDGIAFDNDDTLLVGGSYDRGVICRLMPDLQGQGVSGSPLILSLSGGGAGINAIVKVSPGGLSSIYGTNFAPVDTFAIVQSADLRRQPPNQDRQHLRRDWRLSRVPYLRGHRPD